MSFLAKFYPMFILSGVTIEASKADDQDTLEEETKQNEEVVKVSASSNAVNVDWTEVDGKSFRDGREPSKVKNRLGRLSWLALG